MRFLAENIRKEIIIRREMLSKSVCIGALSVPFKLWQMPETGIEFQKWNVL